MPPERSNPGSAADFRLFDNQISYDGDRAPTPLATHSQNPRSGLGSGASHSGIYKDAPPLRPHSHAIRASIKMPLHWARPCRGR